uniref:Saposin B-type domain-containing protein n=1 Tax=Heterorhabditis bacteriophora TaxID=37862 RepID=A0A1I7WSL7_HETBA
MLRILVSIGICVYLVDNEVNKNKKDNFGLTKEKNQTINDGLGCACPVCQTVIKFTRILILDHIPDEEQVLDKVCRRIFAGEKQKQMLCEDIVKAELSDIIKYVKARVDPTKICTKFC